MSLFHPFSYACTQSSNNSERLVLHLELAKSRLTFIRIVHVLPLHDILGPSSVFRIGTFGPKYVTCGHLDPLGSTDLATFRKMSPYGRQLLWISDALAGILAGQTSEPLHKVTSEPLQKVKLLAQYYKKHRNSNPSLSSQPEDSQGKG